MQDINATLEDLKKLGKKADKEDRERSELFAVMIKSPAWGAYMELLNVKIQGYGSELLSPAGSVDGAMAQEYIKGAMYGMMMARDLPAGIIQAMKDLGPGEESK